MSERVGDRTKHPAVENGSMAEINGIADSAEVTELSERPASNIGCNAMVDTKENPSTSYVADKSTALSFGEPLGDGIAVEVDILAVDLSEDTSKDQSLDSITTKSTQKFRPLSQLLTDKLKRVVIQNGNSTHNTAGKDREKKEARSLKLSQMYSWILCLFVYPILIGCLVLWYYLMTNAIGSVAELQQAYTADILYGVDNNLRKVFALALVALVCTLAFGLGLVLFFYFFWDASEVRSRHHGFVVHFCFGVLMCATMGIAHSAAVLQRTSVHVISLTTGTTTPAFKNLDLWLKLGLFFGIAMIFSAVVSRMRFIYMVFHRRSYRPNYWYGTILHVALFPVIVLSECVCLYTDVECNTAQRLSGAVFYGLFLVVEYTFYLTYTRRASSYFVDWQGNLRCFIVNLFGFWGPVLYALNADESQEAQIAYLTWLVGPFLAWLFGIDNFLFIVVRVLSRRFSSRGLLNQLDLEGGFFRANEQTKDLVALLQIPEGRDLMLAYCHKRHCAEQMQFLLALQGLNEGVGPNARRTGTIFETENTHNHTGNTVDERYMNTEEGVEAIAAMYVLPESEREVNLPQILRDRLLNRIEVKDYEDITVLFQEAYNEISLMISRNLLSDFMHTEAYKAFADKQADDDQIMEIFAKHNMVNRSQNVSCFGTEREYTERGRTERTHTERGAG